jgi:uncharacterized protein YdeI (YjbR/CyaY-like superfamily)
VARAEPQRFRARLQDAGGGGAAFDVPTEAAAALGERKRPPVTVVELPDDLRVALGDDTAARSEFERLSYTHQREYVEWITDAKRADTRARRVAQTVERARTGTPRP